MTPYSEIFDLSHCHQKLVTSMTLRTSIIKHTTMVKYDTYRITTTRQYDNTTDNQPTIETKMMAATIMDYFFHSMPHDFAGFTDGIEQC